MAADVNAPLIAQIGPDTAAADLAGLADEVAGQVGDRLATRFSQQGLGRGGTNFDVQPDGQPQQLVVLLGAVPELRHLEQGLLQGLRWALRQLAVVPERDTTKRVGVVGLGLGGFWLRREPGLHLLDGIAAVAAAVDLGLAGGLAIGAQVERSGQAHDAAGILVDWIGAGGRDQGQLNRAPAFNRDRLSEHPIQVRALAAGGDDERRFTEAELAPCQKLPLQGLGVPLNPKGAAEGDGVVNVAAAVDHQVDAAAFALPLVGHGQVVGALPGANGAAVRIEAMGKGAQPGRRWVFPQQRQELISLAPINRGNGHRMASWVGVVDRDRKPEPERARSARATLAMPWAVALRARSARFFWAQCRWLTASCSGVGQFSATYSSSSSVHQASMASRCRASCHCAPVSLPHLVRMVGSGPLMGLLAGGDGLLQQELNHGGNRDAALSALAVKPLALGLGGPEGKRWSSHG